MSAPVETPCRVHLRDTASGFAATHDTIWHGDYIWSEGNYSCDHNRVLFLGDWGKRGPDDIRAGGDALFNCVSRRIVVDRVESLVDGSTLYEEMEAP